MCMGGGGGGPSKAVQAAEAEAARKAEERAEARKAALTNPEDLARDQSDEDKPNFRTQGRKGLRIDLDAQSSSGGTGLSIKG